MLHDSLSAALAADRQRTLRHEAAQWRLLRGRRMRRLLRPAGSDDHRTR